MAGVAAGRYITQRRRDQRVRRAPGLSGPVTIQRGKYGVPRIIAETREDALFGLGYTMAMDRLFQMDLIRRKANGRLAEIAGPGELESDRLMRLAGIAEASRLSVEHCSGEACAFLDALAAGVNHFMEHHPVPKEFLLAGYRPEPWAPADSVASFLMMGWSLGGSMFRADLFAERCRKVIGDVWTDAIFSGRMAEAPPSIGWKPEPQPRSPAGNRAPVFPESGFSNSWAVSGERSWTGSPMLAFDPHLEYTNPSVWYEAMLEAPGFHVAGMTLPGLPGIGSGRNLHIAWGETAAMVSQSFVYREELDPDGTRVRDGDGWVDLKVHEQTIAVKGQEPEILRIRRTPRGPLVSDLLPDECDGPASLHWTGMEVSTEPDLLYLLNTATSVEEAIAGRSVATVPCYNASIAAVDGSIAQLVVGKLPIREPRPGLLDPADFPPRYIPMDELPVEVNPERGWVAGANSRLVDEDYPYPMFGVWEPPFRMQRITDVLESRRKHSMADMKVLQLDRYSLHAAGLVPVLLDLLSGYRHAWVREELAGWDYVTGPKSRATALFQVFYTHWMRTSLLHRFPADYVSSGLLASGAASVPRDFCDRLLKGELPAWFDGDDGVRRALAQVAMDEALVWLRERLGDDEASWIWGDLNTVTFQHPLGAVPGPQRRAINPGPYPMGGDRTTIWPTAWRSSDGYDVAGGPSMRVVMDLRRPELTWGSNTLGQNGTPWKRHYRDQVNDFLSGSMHRVWQEAVPERGMVIRPE